MSSSPPTECPPNAVPPSLSCPRHGEDLRRWLFGELDEPAAARECDSCQDGLSSLTEGAVAAAVEEAVRAGFASAVLPERPSVVAVPSMVGGVGTSRARWRSSPSPSWWLAAAAALTLAVLGGLTISPLTSVGPETGVALTSPEPETLEAETEVPARSAALVSADADVAETEVVPADPTVIAPVSVAVEITDAGASAPSPPAEAAPEAGVAAGALFSSGFEDGLTGWS